MKPETGYKTSVICVAALVIVLFLNASLSAAALPLTDGEQAWLEEHPVITLGGGIFPPFGFIDEEGASIGLGPDYIKLIGNIIGVDFKLVTGDWHKIQEMAKAKEIDGIRLLTKNEERAQYLNFTTPYLNYNHAIVMKQNAVAETSFSRLAHKRVAVMKASWEHNYLAARYPDIKLTLTSSYEDSLNALITGDAEAVVGAWPILNYHIDKLAVAGLKVTALPPETKTGVSLGIRKDWPELLSIMDKALEVITTDQHRQIKNRWILTGLAGVVTKKNEVKFTPEERAWLKAHPVIRVMGETDYPPWDFIRNRQPAGYGIDYVRLLADRLGVELRFVIAPYGELLGKAQRRELDLLHTTSTFELDGVLFSKPYGRFLQVIVARDDRPDIKREKDLEGMRIAIAKGDEGIRMLKRNVPDVKTVEFSGYREVLLAITEGKADAGIMDSSVASHLIRKHLLYGLAIVDEVKGAHFDPHQEMRLGVRNDWPEFMILIEKAMDTLTAEEMDALNQKWLRRLDGSVGPRLTQSELAWLAEHPSIRFGFNPDMEPLLILDENQKPKGIIPDIFKRLSSITGLNIEIEVNPWHETIKKASRGEVDGLALCVPALAEATGLLPTRGYVSTIPVVFGKRDASLTINSLDDLKGKRVAHMRAVKFIERLLAPLAGEATIIEADSFIDALTMVIEGKADITLGMNFDTYLLNESVLTGIRPIYIDHSHIIKAVTAVRSDWPELVSILNKGLNTIGHATINRVIRKWTQLELPEKELPLTDSEKIWLNEHPVIRVASDSAWAPMEFADKDGTYKGIAIDYLRNIEAKLDIRFEIVEGQPWHKLIDMAKNRRIDMFSCVAETPERRGYLSFSSPYATSPVVIFSKVDTPYIGGLVGLKGKKAAVVKGYAIHETLAREHPDITIVPASDIHQALDMLSSGTVYAYVGNLRVTSYTISKHGYNLVKVAGETSYELSFGMASRNDWPIFAGILQKAIESISEADRKAIFRKWSAVTYEHGFDYSLFLNFLAIASFLFVVLLLYNNRLKSQVAKKTSELVSSEKRLKAIFNHRFQLTGLLAPDGRLIMANENVYNMMGAAPSDLEDKYIWELPLWSHSEELQNKVRDGVLKVQKGDQINFETTHRDTKDNIHVIDFSLTPVRDEKGEVIFIVPEGHDITAKKQSENRLIESERNYREIYNSSSDAIIIHDAKTGKLVDVNQTMLDMFGYTYEEALRLEIGQICSGEPPYAQKDALDKIHKAVHEGPQLFEWDTRRKDGSRFRIEVALSNTTIGGKGRVLAVVRDITERKRLDAELRLVKHSIEHSTDPFFLIQKDARFIYVNDAACRYLNYNREKLCAMQVSDIDPNFPAEIWPEFWEKVKLQKKVIVESAHITKGGDIIPVEITCNYSEFEDHEHVFSYVKDMREKIKQEEEQERLEKQLRQSQKMEAMGTLAGGIAHDFNNILSIIFGCTQIAGMNVEKNIDKARQNLEHVTIAASRAKDLVQQILTFSRMSEHEKNPLILSSIVKETLKLLRSSIPTTIAIDRNIESEKKILADATQITQVVMNLCTNAYHAMKESDGTITVSLRDIEVPERNAIPGLDMEPGSYVRLSVSDTGCGMDEETIRKIFDPYFTTKGRGEGTGLGLAVVHGIVTNHNGVIDLESKPGEGTTFEIFFPVFTEKTVKKRSPDDQRDVVKGSENILVVDDEASIVAIMEDILADCGYKVTPFTESGFALKEFRKDPDQFDLIVTDFAMPEINGIELMKQIRQIRSRIPVILCSGYEDLVSREPVDEFKMHRYNKPIIVDDFLKLVQQVLKEHAPEKRDEHGG